MRDEIGVAVITHAHPDHVPGFIEFVDGELVPTFPSARHVISKAEWRYWVDEDPGEPSAGMVPMVRPSLTALRDAGVLDLVDGDEEIADGITLLPTPGHTPGHMSVLVASGGETCVVAGDVVLTEWAFEHPEWTAIPEVDPGLVVRTRRALFDRLVESGGLLPRSTSSAGTCRSGRERVRVRAGLISEGCHMEGRSTGMVRGRLCRPVAARVLEPRLGWRSTRIPWRSPPSA
jgi:glyoxylase-like metal-dependent hydrolase (beta-lactamase superfamily II)